MKYLLLVMMFLPVFALAAEPQHTFGTPPTNDFGTPAQNDFGTSPQNNFNSGGPQNTFTVEPPLSHGNTICDIFVALYHVAILIGIPVSVAFLVLAGFKLVWAQGRPTQLSEAHANLMWTLIGIGFFFGMFAAAQLLSTVLIAVGFVDHSTLCQ